MESSTTGNGTGRARYGINAEEGCPPPLLLPAVRTLAPLVASVFFLGISSQAWADVLNVPSRSYPTIQSALDAAATSGDEIVVAAGTYHEVINFNAKAVNLHSSDGAATTIINGSDAITGFPLGGPVVSCVNGEGSGTIFDGFTVTGGHTGASVGPDTFGLGMRLIVTSPIIKNCIFKDNSSPSNLTYGAGIGITGGGSPEITNCQFINNTLNTSQVTYGGAIFISAGNPTISGCTFQGNTAGGGGGIQVSSSSGTTIGNCAFSSNVAKNGAGILCGGSGGTISNCTFLNNQASLGASDISGGGGICSNDSSTSISNCSFNGNQAAYGAGVYVDHLNTAQPSPTITDCTFVGNSSPGAGSPGAGMAIRSSKPRVTNCVFDGNTTASFGGGIYASKSGAIIANCIFKHNTGAGGGGIALELNNNPTQTYFPIVTNCTIVENNVTLANRGAGVEIIQGATTQISPARISNCIIRDNAGPTSSDIRFPTTVFAGWITLQDSNVKAPILGQFIGSGNIDADPMFADASSGDFHLLNGSPCVDAGYPWDLLIAGISTDLDGNPRFQDGDDDHVTWTDMGTFEYPELREGEMGEWAPAPLVYWHFNTFAGGSGPIAADLGTGTIDTTGWAGAIGNGTGALTGPGALFDINRYKATPAVTSLQLLGGSTANNGSIKLSFSMSGRENLKLTFVGSRSHFNTFNNGAWAWSTDGTNFTTMAGVNTCPSSLSSPWSALQTVDFSGVPALNNTPSVTLRYTLSGASGGADRYTTIDNIQLNATQLPLPPNPADITGDGIVDIDDLFAVINAWGPCPDPENCDADIAPIGPPQGDDIVDIDDLFTVINNWS